MKITEDIKKAWKYHLIYMNMNLGWLWLQQIYCISAYYSSHIWEEKINGK